MFELPKTQYNHQTEPKAPKLKLYDFFQQTRLVPAAGPGLPEMRARHLHATRPPDRHQPPRTRRPLLRVLQRGHRLFRPTGKYRL